MSDEAKTLAERFHAGRDTAVSSYFSFVSRQFWACGTCGQKRQYGTTRLSLAIKAAEETGEKVEQEPLLYCERCQDNRRHCFSHDEITA